MTDRRTYLGARLSAGDDAAWGLVLAAVSASAGNLTQAQNVTLRRNRDDRSVVVAWTVGGIGLSECTSGLAAGRRLADSLRFGAVRFTATLRRRYRSWDRKGEELWVSVPA